MKKKKIKKVCQFKCQFWDSDKVCSNCQRYKYPGICRIDDKKTNPNNYCSYFKAI